MSQQPESKKSARSVAKSDVIADDGDDVEANVSDVDVDDDGDENEMVVVIDHSQGSDGEQVMPV